MLPFNHYQILRFMTVLLGNIYLYLFNLNLWFCFRCRFQRTPLLLVFDKTNSKKKTVLLKQEALT